MRTQEERIHSLKTEIDRISAKFTLGHMLLIFEIERKNGLPPAIGNLFNTELQTAVGIIPLGKDEAGVVTRAEELVLQAWDGIVQHGLVAEEIGKDYWPNGGEELAVTK